MIKLENYEVMGWEHAIRGMRNPMNSWDKSDSYVSMCELMGSCEECPHNGSSICITDTIQVPIIGPNDHDLMTRLRNAGTDHRKFMRMITVYVDITAPLYWWKEFDTYKVGTVANSCSTMHKIHEKEFTRADFSCGRLMSFKEGDSVLLSAVPSALSPCDMACAYSPMDVMDIIIDILNDCRSRYLTAKDGCDGIYAKDLWYQMIQLLPTSYNQKRTVMLNYEVLANIYKSRKNHKLDEWHGFCHWIEELPYSELITGVKEVKAE